MKKLLVVYNICGLDGDNTKDYLESLASIFSQNFRGFDVVVSSCMSNDACLDAIKNKFKKIKIFHTNFVAPVNVTFNNACMKSKELMGDYHGYLYIDSGITFHDKNTFKTLYKFLKTKKYGMVSLHVDDDSGVAEWGISEDIDTELPVGKAVNLHVQIWSKELFDFYGRLMPDIFAGHCTESTFSFMCAALKKKWLYTRTSSADHKTSLDGMSLGFSPHEWTRETSRPTFDHPFIVPSIVDRVCTEEAYSLGMGYEEMRGVMNHDASHYDENGHCINDELKWWIKENLFLKEEEFDYNNLHTRTKA